MIFSKIKRLVVQNQEIRVKQIDGQDYICISDMVNLKDGDFFVSDWLRNRNTLEFLSVWESIYNTSFNYGEFAIIKNSSGLNNFKISVKQWVEKTNAKGLVSSPGRLGGRSKIVLTQEQKEPINKLMQSGKSIYYISTKLGIGYNIVKRHFNNLKGEQ